MYINKRGDIKIRRLAWVVDKDSFLTEMCYYPPAEIGRKLRRLIMSDINKDPECNDMMSFLHGLAIDAYYMGVMDGKREERAKKKAHCRHVLAGGRNEQ